jgi:hypothetical protein
MRIIKDKIFQKALKCSHQLFVIVTGPFRDFRQDQLRQQHTYYHFICFPFWSVILITATNGDLGSRLNFYCFYVIPTIYKSYHPG